SLPGCRGASSRRCGRMVLGRGRWSRPRAWPYSRLGLALPAETLAQRHIEPHFLPPLCGGGKLKARTKVKAGYFATRGAVRYLPLPVSQIAWNVYDVLFP